MDRTSLSAALQLLLPHAGSVTTDRVASEDSLGRVTAAPVRAAFPSPYHRVSAMDGIAVHSADTQGAGPATPVVLHIAPAGAAGKTPGEPHCMPVDTGNALPAWADAVVRIEDTKRHGESFEILEPVAPLRDVRRSGEDVDAGTTILPTGHTIRPWDIGAMLATGVIELAVAKRPSVAVLATGLEVIEPGTAPEPGQVIEFNSRVMSGFVSEWGGSTTYLGRVDDEADSLAGALRAAAAEYDIVCVIAGSSAGSKDFTGEAISRCGELLAHGVGIMPGHPVAIGAIDGKPVIGVPGYPVSAIIVYQQFLYPLICALLGTQTFSPLLYKGRVRRKIASRLGVEEFLRVCICRHDADSVVAPLPRGAGSITSIVRADGLLRIPESVEGIDSGSEVTVELLRPLSDIGKAVVVAGRPDSLTDSLQPLLVEGGSGCHITHLGLSDSEALLSVASGESHLAVLGYHSPISLEELRTQASQAIECYELLAWQSSDGTRTAAIVAETSFADSVNGRKLLSSLGGNSLPGDVNEMIGTGCIFLRESAG